MNDEKNEQTVFWERDKEGVVTLTFDAPDSSANIFTLKVMGELRSALLDIAMDNFFGSVKALLIESAKDSVFIAGADIGLIQAIEDEGEASNLSHVGQDIFEMIEKFPFPTAALIHGSALGGGLEITLACDVRFASDDARTRLGLPETSLGVIPAWGGCTRLPRIVGVEKALDMILTGKDLSAQQAKDAGLVDGVVRRENLRRRALEYLNTNPSPSRSPGFSKSEGLDICNFAESTIAEEVRTLYPAHRAAIDAVRRGLKRRSDGFKAEQKRFGELSVSETCKALIQLFWNTETARKNRGADAQSREVSRAAVVGAGVMGSGIAYLFANSQVPVRVSDAQEEALAGMLARTRDDFAFQVGRGRLSQRDAGARHMLISPTTDMGGFEHADFIVEAVFENLEVKQAIFKQLSEMVPSDCVLASNTSTIPIAKIAEAVEHPERVIGMHFFNPPKSMKLIEIVVADATSPETVATTFALAKRLGKIPIYVRDCPGFLVNRLLMPYEIAAIEAFLDGVPIELLDKIMMDWGMSMGPIATLDHVGLDVARDVARTLEAAYPDRMNMPEALERLVDEGYLGGKNNTKGFWQGPKGERSVNPDVYRLCGVTANARSYDEDEIRERLLRPMVEEARRCLQEGIVLSSGDIDLSLVLGIGFPAARGAVVDLL